MAHGMNEHRNYEGLLLQWIEEAAALHKATTEYLGTQPEDTEAVRCAWAKMKAATRDKMAREKRLANVCTQEWMDGAFAMWAAVHHTTRGLEELR